MYIIYITCKKANTVAVAQEKKHFFSSLQVLILLFQFLCNSNIVIVFTNTIYNSKLNSHKHT